MRHFYVDETMSGEHYAVGHNGLGLVLLQTQDNSKYPGGQGRCRLKPEQARHCAKLLEEAALEAERIAIEEKHRAAAARGPKQEEVDDANAGYSYSDADPGL